MAVSEWKAKENGNLLLTRLAHFDGAALTADQTGGPPRILLRLQHGEDAGFPPTILESIQLELLPEQARSIANLLQRLARAAAAEDPSSIQ